MGKDLLKVQSKSTNDTYNIVLGQDYRIYCTCKAWQFSRPPIKECKHLRDLFAVEGDRVMLELQKPTTTTNPDYRCVLRAVVL
jgi:hypothetical protein|tara:strand:- start:552 stop:800 length:249 start_codon:yes stop_codon:yes gene_type:complete